MKRLPSRKSLTLLAVIAVNILNAVGGLLGEAIGDDIKEILTRAGIFQYRLHITGGLLITGLLVAVWVFKADKNEIKDGIQTEFVPESEKALRRFLADLAERYRKRIAHKLDERYEISLVVTDDLEGAHARQFEEEFGADAHADEAAHYIIERFESQGRLLVVGSPGSGKTVLLLTLARHLVVKAQKDPRQPLPVIFNLDSWSPYYERFDDWVKATLTKGYGLSPDLAEQLLAEQRIVFLLDGLDELARNEEPDRAARLRGECLVALDKSLHDGTMSAVICCRREQFNLMLRQTNAAPPVAAMVAVQDLTPVQIGRALLRASAMPRDKFAAPHLLGALGRDPDGVYRQVLSTPFYFTTALQVFDSTKPPLIEACDRQTLESNLVAAFIEKKLKVTPNARHFDTTQTLDWLTWLAAFLNSRERVTFELADLQPSALKRAWPYRIFFCMICGVPGGLLAGLPNGVAYGLFFSILFALFGIYMVTEDFGQWTLAPLRRWRTWRNILGLGLLAGILFGVVSALVELVVNPTTNLAANGRPAYLLVLVAGTILLGVVVSMAAIIFGTVTHLVVRMIVGISGGVAVSNIVTEDFAQWTLAPLGQWRTWRGIFVRSLSASVTAGAIGYGMIFIASCAYSVAVVGLKESIVVTSLAFLLMSTGGGLLSAAVGLAVNIFLGVFRACRKITGFARINSPYQRLRAGLGFNMFQGAVMGAGFVCLPVMLWLVFIGGGIGTADLIDMILIMLTFGLLGLYNTPLFKHLVLRVCLALESAIPLRYADFLSYATELRILENEGGQWRFRHQTLQDYFAGRPQNHGNGFAQTR